MLHDGRKHQSLQRIEYSRISEEAGDVDEHVLIQRLDFGGIGLHITDVIFDVIEFMDQHAALDASPDGGLAVVSEINASAAAKELENRAHRGSVRRGNLTLDHTRRKGVRKLGDPPQLASDLLGGENIVDATGCCRAARHAV